MENSEDVLEVQTGKAWAMMGIDSPPKLCDSYFVVSRLLTGIMVPIPSCSYKGIQSESGFLLSKSLVTNGTNRLVIAVYNMNIEAT